MAHSINTATQNHAVKNLFSLMGHPYRLVDVHYDKSQKTFMVSYEQTTNQVDQETEARNLDQSSQLTTPLDRFLTLLQAPPLTA